MVRLSIYVVWPSVLSLNNLQVIKIHETRAVKEICSPWAIPLPMITMRKSTQGFSSLSYMGIELCLYLYSYICIWGSVGIINCSAWQPFGLPKPSWNITELIPWDWAWFPVLFHTLKSRKWQKDNIKLKLNTTFFTAKHFLLLLTWKHISHFIILDSRRQITNKHLMIIRCISCCQSCLSTAHSSTDFLGGAGRSSLRSRWWR